MRTRRNSKTGLSIVEVLLILAIGTLILLIAIPAIRTNRAKQQAAACVLEMDMLDRACRAHASRLGGFPEQMTDLIPDFMPRLPVCPAGGTYQPGTPEGDPPTCSIPGHTL